MVHRGAAMGAVRPCSGPCAAPGRPPGGQSGRRASRPNPAGRPWAGGGAYTVRTELRERPARKVNVSIRSPFGGAKLISHLSSPTDRPTLPAGVDSDSGSSDRPTLRRAQRGEARGSEIVGDCDLGDCDRLADRPTPSDRPGMGRKRPDRPTHSRGPRRDDRTFQIYLHKELNKGTTSALGQASLT